MKALVGSWENRPYRLLAEVTALRSRVVELESELDALRRENAALRESARDADDRTVVLTGS